MLTQNDNPIYDCMYMGINMHHHLLFCFYLQNDSSLLHICSHNEDPNMFYFLLNKGCDYTHINVKEKNEKNGKNVIGYSNYDVYNFDREY